jgi:hypothetical protein
VEEHAAGDALSDHDKLGYLELQVGPTTNIVGDQMTVTAVMLVEDELISKEAAEATRGYVAQAGGPVHA